MNKFSRKDKVFDLLETNHHLLPVINRFGLGLGNKDKSIATLCKEKDINAEFLLLIINTFNNEEYFPEDELKAFSPLLIIDYLRKTHIHYNTYVLPKLQQLLHQLIKSDKTESKELLIIEKFYHKYKTEVLLHLKEEEELLFPYITKLINGTSRKDYSIHTFEKEHTNVDTKLKDLKSLIIKYIEPVYDQYICTEFLITLYDFEKDLNDHARIEDTILIPIVLDIERENNEN